MKPQKFGWSAASKTMPDDYYSKLNIWYAAYSEQLNPLVVELSSKVLRSNTELAGIYEDEGGPLSNEPDELAQLYIETIQSIIPDGMLISCRVFKDVRGFSERPVFRYDHIGADKPQLGKVFNRFGVDPDS